MYPKRVQTILDLFKIEHPIIQGGMVWVSGGKLAAAVSQAGGLGLIGAGSMKPDLLRKHIVKAKSLTTKPIGVNLPLLYKDVEKQSGGGTACLTIDTLVDILHTYSNRKCSAGRSCHFSHLSVSLRYFITLCILMAGSSRSISSHLY